MLTEFFSINQLAFSFISDNVESISPNGENTNRLPADCSALGFGLKGVCRKRPLDEGAKRTTELCNRSAPQPTTEKLPLAKEKLCTNGLNH